jgi:ATP-dependent DNA ligase
VKCANGHGIDVAEAREWYRRAAQLGSSLTAKTCGVHRLLRGKHAGIPFNEHSTADGAIIYRHACALGCEGIVSKRLGSAYRSGRADCRVKVKNPAAPAVTREAEKDWDRRAGCDHLTLIDQ